MKSGMKMEEMIDVTPGFLREAHFKILLASRNPIEIYKNMMKIKNNEISIDNLNV